MPTQIPGADPLPVSVWNPGNVYLDTRNGSDSNSGYAATHPKKTWNAAYALLRDGQPDTLHIALGSTFTDSPVYWGKSGQGKGNPMVVTYYDPPQNPGQTERPKFTITNSDSAFYLSGRPAYLRFEGLAFHGGSGTTQSSDYVAINGEHTQTTFYDCYFTNWFECFVINAGQTGVNPCEGNRYEKCIFYNLYQRVGYWENCTGLNFIDCVVDKFNVSGPESVYSMTFYISEYYNTDYLVEGCAFHDSGTALDSRSPGEMRYNLFSYTKRGPSVGPGWDGNTDQHCYGSIHHNVVTEMGQPTSGEQVAAVGITIQDADDLRVYENIVCNPIDNVHWDLLTINPIRASNPASSHVPTIDGLVVRDNIIGFGFYPTSYQWDDGYFSLTSQNHPEQVVRNIEFYNNKIAGPPSQKCVIDPSDFIANGRLTVSYGNQFYRYTLGDTGGWFWSWAADTGNLALYLSETGDPTDAFQQASSYTDWPSQYPNGGRATCTQYQATFGGSPGHVGFFQEACARKVGQPLGKYDIKNVVIPWMRAQFGRSP